MFCGVCIPKFFNKNVDFYSVIVKGASLTCCTEVVDIGSESFITLLLHFHNALFVDMNICITELQPKDAFEFTPAFPCLKGLEDESVGLDVCGSLLKCPWQFLSP